MKSESIAITSINLSNSRFSVKNKLKESKNESEIKELEKKLANVEEDLNILEKKIENKAFEVFKDNDVIEVGLFPDQDCIDIMGFRMVSDVECQKMVKFLGYKHYTIQVLPGFLTIYFYNEWHFYDE